MLLCPSLLPAAKVKVWHQHTPAQYDKAQLKEMVLSNEGVLRLSRQLRPLAGLDATHVWDMVEDRDGNLFVATGDEGKIYKVPAQGKPTVVHAGEQGQVLCLALASDGSIYAGTGPHGQILRIDPRGKTKVFSETGESYVWSLAIDPKGQALYAGTGPHGRIYRINGDGKATRVLPDAPGSHPLSGGRRRRHALRRHRQGRTRLSHRSARQGLRALPGETGRNTDAETDAGCRLCRHQLADTATENRRGESVKP